jgi:hypothetical protein
MSIHQKLQLTIVNTSIKKPLVSPSSSFIPQISPSNSNSTLTMSPAPLSPIPPTISPSNPQSTTPPTPSLNSLVATDLAASNELAERITQLRLDIANGKPLPPKKVDLTERSNRDMVKDLVSRVEKIETSAELDATDRETLQALNARLAICDLQAMRLAELRDLEVGARMGRKVIGLRAEGVEEEEEEEDGLSDGDGDDFERVGEHDSNSACDSHSEDDDNNTTSSTYSSDLSPNTTTWPLLYRILDVDPGVSGSDIKPMLTRYLIHSSHPLAIY